jgi:hypothetical protein
LQIFDQEIPLKENLRFSLNRYTAWWIILLVTMIFDFFTTIYFVDKYGVATEGNSLVSWLIRNLGLVAGVLVGRILQLIPVTVSEYCGNQIARQ